MRPRNLIPIVAVLGLFVTTPLARAEASAAAKAYETGQALLAQADFEGALAAFKTAAETDTENKTYFDACATLKRVLKLREQIRTEAEADTWRKLANALYHYYFQHKIFGEALPLATAMHAKDASGESAGALAEVQLALDKNAEAAELLASLDPDKATLQTNILHGVALARLGKADDAKAAAAKIELPTKDCDGATCYAAARLYALVGERDKALKTLQCAFECTPAAWLDSVKADAKECKDLQALANCPNFAKVLETQSKVKGCGGCTKPCSKTCTKDEEKAAGCPGHGQGETKNGDKDRE